MIYDHSLSAITFVFPLTAKRLDGVHGIPSGVDLEAGLFAEQVDVNGRFIVMFT